MRGSSVRARWGLVLVVAVAASAAPAGQSEGEPELPDRTDLVRMRELGAWGELSPEALVRILESYVPLSAGGDHEAAVLVNEAARHLQGFAELEPRLVDALEAVHRRGIDEGPAGAAADVVFPLAQHLRAAGEDARALEALTGTVQALPPGHSHRPYVTYALADVLLRRRDWSEAEAAIEEALRSIEEFGGDPSIRSALLGLLGESHLGLGRHDRAYPLVRENLDTQEALYASRPPATSASFLIAAHLHLARFYSETSRFEELLRDVEPVLDREDWGAARPDALSALLVPVGVAYVFRVLSDPDADEAQVSEWLARAELRFTQALEGAATADLDRLRSEQWAAFLAARGGRWDRVAELLQAAEEHLAERGADGAADSLERQLQAVMAARLARARSSRDEMEAARSALLQTFEAMMAEWHAVAPRAGGIGHLSGIQARWVVSESILLALALDGEGAAGQGLELLERALSAGSLVRGLGGAAPSLDRMQSLLGEGEGALILLPLLLDDTHVFLLDGRGVGHFAARPRIELRPWIDDWVRLLSSRPPAGDSAAALRRASELDRLGSEIVERLLPPEVRSALRGWSSVTIVAADLGEYLPFECLPLEGELLGTTHAVSYVPSFALAAALEARLVEPDSVERAQRDVTLVLEPAPSAPAVAAHPHVARLGLTRAEREALVEAFEGERLLVLAGPHATAEAFEAAAASTRAMAHLFVHGVQDPARERSAGLVLSASPRLPDGLAFAPVLEGLRLPPLVVLSACGAGSGPVREGDGGASDLSGACLGAGAHTVVLSTTDLAVGATVELMRAFQRELVAGVPTAEALRRARVHLRSTERYSDPFHHSLVHAVGLAGRAVFPAESRAPGPWRALLVAGSVAALLAALLLARRRTARGA